MKERIKDTVQDSNLNFLFGSGLSAPYLKILGNIEVLLTELEQRSLSEDQKKIIRASLYKKFFDGVIAKNTKILEAAPEADGVLESYHNFLKFINSILLRRKSTILSKEANIFTTNVDIFLDKGLEDIGLEYNDGFNGRFKPSFSLSNFKKSHFKKSLHYDNTSELPVFNLLKLHGSLSWEIAKNNGIVFSCDLAQVKEVQNKIIGNGNIVDIADNATMDDLVADVSGKTMDPSIGEFLKAYEKLLIINPTKEKFKQSLLNQTYYELLRIYSNELEKENTVLFVMGFSFADEHIKEMTLRAANSNPTLMIYVIAHSSKGKADIEARLGMKNVKNNNIEIIAPPQKRESDGSLGADEFMYDFATINQRIFGQFFEDGEYNDLPVECLDDSLNQAETP